MATRTLFCDPPEDAVSRAPALAPARSRQDGLLSIAFLALILLPGLANTSHFDILGGGSAPDGRPKPFPTLERSWASLRSYGGRVQTYVQENFGFRKQLIRGHALLTAQVLRISPSPTVLWGREGWLYYAGDGGAEDIIAKTPFTEAELTVWRTILIHNRDWLRERGIEYVFTLAPDKPEIYPEYLPPSPRRLGAGNRLDELAAHLRDHTDLVVVDLKTPLREAKTRERVFDRTDTHWNRRGAYVGYGAILGAVAARVPGVERPWPRTDFTPTRAITPGKDLTEMLGLEDVWSEEELSLAPVRPRLARVVEPPHPSPNGDEGYLVTEIAGSTLPRAVLFRDSFTSRLIPYVSEHFSRTVYVWQNDVDLEVVEKERPAVVIHEIVGRHLTTLVPYDAVASRMAKSH